MIRIQTLVSSFAGGFFTVNGTNLSSSSYILVNGLRGEIRNYTKSYVIYNAPALITNNSQNIFKLTKSKFINSSLFTVDSDNGSTNSSAAFDKIVTTYYGSNNSDCFIRMNFNENIQISIDKFGFFPNLNWVNTARKLFGATFEGSNNNVDW